MTSIEREKSYTKEARTVIDGSSRLIAAECGSRIIRTNHLAIALLENSSKLIQFPLEKLGINSHDHALKLRHELGTRDTASAQDFVHSQFGEGAFQVIKGADEESTSPYVGAHHLLLSLLARERDNPTLGFAEIGLDYDSYRNAVAEIAPNSPGQVAL